MKTTPTRGDSLDVLHHLNWPPASVGGRLIVGESAWRSAVARTVPQERVAFFRALQRPLLVATTLGRARLREWLDEKRERPAKGESLPARRRRVTRNLTHFGDLSVLPLLADTIARLPAPVVDLALRECLTIVVGRETAGFITGPLPRLRPIPLSGALNDEDLADTLRHELGHAWLIRHEAEAPTAAAHAVAMNGLLRQVPRERLRQMDDDAEAAAWALTWSWA